MRIFGRMPVEYVKFAAGVLSLIVVVGVLRFGLHQAGASVAQVKWVSLTGVMVLGALYLGITVHTRGLGSYKQLLATVLVQQVVAQGLIILAILLSAATGAPNIYSRPEFSPPVGSSTWVHIAGHVVAGVGVGSVVLWALGSLAMLVTKRLTRPRERPRPIDAAPPSEPAPAIE